MDPEKEKENELPPQAQIFIAPVYRSHRFVVNGFGIRFDLAPRTDEIGVHPIDILQNDLGRILEIVQKLERFT